MRPLVLFLALVAAVPIRMLAQAPPSFEVASIKRNTSDDFRSILGFQPGGRFTGTNVTLPALLQGAYGFQVFQIVGGPDWVRSERFDLVAKAEHDFGDIAPGPPPPHGAPPNSLQLMIRTLLAERFGLKVHIDTREMPVYELVMSGSRPGRQLRPAATDCEALRKAAREPGGPPPPPPATGGAPVSCGMWMLPGSLSAGSMAVAQLAVRLSPIVGRTVIDRTGLTGNYDFELKWTPDQMPPTGLPSLPPIDANGPSIFTAVKEQLGLELESAKGPVEVLVIDQVERPAPD